MAKLSSVIGVGFIFGPLLGSLLSRYHLRLPLVISALLFLLDVIAGFLFLPETQPQHHQHPEARPSSQNNLEGNNNNASSKLAEFWSALVSPVGKVLLKRFFLAAMHLLFQETLLLFAAARFSVDSKGSGPILSFLGLLSVFVQGIVVPTLHRHLEEKVFFLILLTSLRFSRTKNKTR